ncbi:hypothetical protein [Phormidium nigroviride]
MRFSRSLRFFLDGQIDIRRRKKEEGRRKKEEGFTYLRRDTALLIGVNLSLKPPGVKTPLL